VSRYEILHAALGRLRMRKTIALMLPAAVAAILTVRAVDSVTGRLLAALAVLIVVQSILHRLWRATFPAYRTWSDRSSQITAEISDLRRRIAHTFDQYRDLKEALSVGMFRERREVFVTALVRVGVAVRVTASIGSPFRCSATDNPARWSQHAERLGCDEIRQYHNHPVHNGTTCPSSTDTKTSAYLKWVRLSWNDC
jgi:hypothetical protein